MRSLRRPLKRLWRQASLGAKPESALHNLLQVPMDLLTVLAARGARTRFVLFAQGRSGSTLLESLLACHPEVCRATELLLERRRKRSLRLYVEAQSRLVSCQVWGFKAKVHQLSRNQAVDPGRFLRRLDRAGWKIIHLSRRDLLRQAVSHFVRLHRGASHKHEDGPEPLPLHVDCDALLAQIRDKERYRLEEEAALAHVPHVRVVYEDDLLPRERHQQTADRLFRFLGVEPVPVQTKFVKITPERLVDVVDNFDEVVAALRSTPYARFLDARDRGHA